MRHREVDTSGNLEFVGRSAFGSHEHDAVGTAHTVDRCGRCILEHREALDIGGVKLTQISFKTVDEHQCAGVGAESADTADPEVGDILAGLTALLY